MAKLIFKNYIFFDHFRLFTKKNKNPKMSCADLHWPCCGSFTCIWYHSTNDLQSKYGINEAEVVQWIIFFFWGGRDKPCNHTSQDLSYESMKRISWEHVLDCLFVTRLPDLESNENADGKADVVSEMRFRSKLAGLKVCAIVSLCTLPLRFIFVTFA